MEDHQNNQSDNIDLQADLERLRGELLQVKSLDPSAKERASELLAEVEKIVQNLEQPSEEDHQGLTEALRESITHFDATHPNLTFAMRDVINTLANLGF